MSNGHCGFRRARRPEQVEVRRAAILAAAAAMLRERPLADISLRELSERVGLAKSNVLRYFDSREAIFLEVLDQVWGAWLDALEVEMRGLRGSEGGYRREVELAGLVADALVRAPQLCELLCAMGSVLERNISVDFARTFKHRAIANNDRFAAMIRQRLPRLGVEDAGYFAGAVPVIVAGLWPLANPTDAVATVMAELGSPLPDKLFAHALAEGLTNQLVGMAVRRAGLTAE